MTSDIVLGGSYVAFASLSGFVSRARPCSVFHFINGYTEGNKVHVDMCVSDVPAFAFMREAGGLHMNASPSRQLLIGGRWCSAASGHALDVFDPATGEVFAQAAAGGAEDIDSAVKAARH